MTALDALGARVMAFLEGPVAGVMVLGALVAGMMVLAGPVPGVMTSGGRVVGVLSSRGPVVGVKASGGRVAGPRGSEERVAVAMPLGGQVVRRTRRWTLAVRVTRRLVGMGTWVQTLLGGPDTDPRRRSGVWIASWKRSHS